MAQAADDIRVWTVSEVNRRVRQAIEDGVGTLWVAGEVSNWKRNAASGHCYFTLKDAGAQLRAVLFRGSQRGMKFEPADGMRVRAYGPITVYEPRGEYQLMVQRLEADGQGDLHRRFEELKARLQAEGLFEVARKRPLPLLPRHIGVVTSPTGAAVRDILHVLLRRFPNVHVLLAPVRVQGAGAAGEIATAIDTLNRRGGLDVLIVGRGGGSIEDLWAFNEEVVARAIARSAIPVISAVGHETDFTIADFVADVRAATPSAAAETVVGRKDVFEETLRAFDQRLGAALQGAVLRLRNRVLRASGHPVFTRPAALIQRARVRVESLRHRMTHEATALARNLRQTLDESAMGMAHAARLHLERDRQRMLRAEGGLRTLNPLGVLGRGYSITRGADGRVVKRAADVRRGERITTLLGQGRLNSTVEDTQKV